MSRDCGALRLALSDLIQLDPTIEIKSPLQNGSTIVCGMSELHLDSSCDRIQHDYKIQIDVGAPAVILLETIREAVEGEGKYIRQTGGMGNYGHVKIRLEPSAGSKGFQFINAIRRDAIPSEFIASIEEGIREAMLGGVLFGHEVVDVKVTLIDGSYHDTDSNKMA